MEKGLQRDFPASAIRTADGLRVIFRRIPACEFIDPFSHETVFRRTDACRTEKTYSWEEILRYRKVGYGLTPRGIIMHPARVGSTLQVACLRCVEGIVSYSEPMVVNDLLTPEEPRPPIEWTREVMVAGLRLLAHLLGRHATQPFVLKLRSWNCLFADLISEAFPLTPWVFAIRDPLEIGVSLERKAPTWMRARGLAENPFMNFIGAPASSLTEEKYFATMFRSFCESIGKLSPERGLLIRYENLPEAVWESVCPHFGIVVPFSAVTRMKAAALFDAKSAFGVPRLFVPDAKQKRQAASQPLHEAVEQIARPALRELEISFQRTSPAHERLNNLTH